jgi:hypothetical protein
LVEALVVAAKAQVLPAVRAEAVLQIMVVELVVELELLDKEIMVEAVATEMVTVVLEAEVLEAAEAGVLLLVEKDKVMVLGQGQAVPA